jgi:hypothetical protein
VGPDLLAPFVVGDSEDDGLGDGRMFEQHRLDLLRVDVDASGDDRVVLPAREEQVAVFVEVAEVADGERVVPPRGSGLALVTPIPEPLGPPTPDPHLSHFVGRYLPAVVVQHEELRSGEGGADAAGFAQPLGRGDARRLSLRRPVELPYRPLGERIDHTPFRLGSDRCARVRERSHRREVVTSQLLRA